MLWLKICVSPGSASRGRLLLDWGEATCPSFVPRAPSPKITNTILEYGLTLFPPVTSGCKNQDGGGQTNQHGYSQNAKIKWFKPVVHKPKGNGKVFHYTVTPDCDQAGSHHPFNKALFFPPFTLNSHFKVCSRWRVFLSRSDCGLSVNPGPT